MTQEEGRALHRAAMERMDEFDRLVRAGRPGEARLSAMDALQFERRALDEPLVEPFRSLVYRSAASIALDADLPADALALIGAALAEDDLPSAVASQMRELGRTARQRSQSSTAPGMWHRLRIFTTGRSPVTMDTASRAVGLWLDYLKVAVKALLDEATQSTRSPQLAFLPVTTTSGSFVTSIDIIAPPAEQRHLATVVTQLRDAVIEGRMPPPTNLRAWLDVLDTLANDSLGLEAVLMQGGHDNISFGVAAEAVSVQRGLVEKAASTKLFSSEVPQADDLQKVFRLLEQAKRAEGRPDARKLGLVPRQLNYYRSAAEVLRFLDPDHAWRLTDAAERLVTLNHDQQLAFTAVEFEATRVGRAWIEWSRARTLCDVEPDSATEFIRATVLDLSEATVRRRAQTLAAWVRALVPHHYAKSQ
jgi:hypothetical protein